VAIPEFDTSMVAFLAAEEEGASQKHKAGLRLITALKDTENLELHPERQISEQDQEHGTERLKEMALSESEPARAVKAIEEDNRRAARAQLLLDMVTAFALINDLDAPDDEPFWPTVKAMDRRLEKETVLRLSKLWAEPLRAHDGNFLFHVDIPQLDSWARIEAPRFLGTCALDISCRIADSIHRKKAEITLGMVLDRIERGCTAKVLGTRGLNGKG